MWSRIRGKILRSSQKSAVSNESDTDISASLCGPVLPFLLELFNQTLVVWNSLNCTFFASYVPKIKHPGQRSDSRADGEFFMVGWLLRRRECEACVELLNMCCSISRNLLLSVWRGQSDKQMLKQHPVLLPAFHASLNNRAGSRLQWEKIEPVPGDKNTLY